MLAFADATDRLPGEDYWAWKERTNDEEYDAMAIAPNSIKIDDQVYQLDYRSHFQSDSFSDFENKPSFPRSIVNSVLKLGMGTNESLAWVRIEDDATTEWSAGNKVCCIFGNIENEMCVLNHIQIYGYDQ